jgi:cytoskeletal protein CcmA (bactofilin family)
MTRKRSLVLAGLAAISLALVPSLSLAFGARTGDNITLAKGETHHGTLYAAGQTLSIDGDVDGDLICAGSVVTVNGAVHGDVLCAGQTVTVNGEVDGNIRAAGQSVTVNGHTSRNVSVAGQAFTLGSAAKVDGELALLGETASVDGSVGRDLYGKLSSLHLSGAVTGNVDGDIQDLAFSGNGHVNGNLTYTSSNATAVDPVRVAGKVARHEPPKEAQPSPRDQALNWLMDRAYWIVADLLIALLLIGLAPAALQRVTSTMTKRPGASFGWGAVVVLAGPIAVLLLLFTVVGIPLALLAGGAWLIALCLSTTLTAVAVGRSITTRTDWNSKSLPLAALVGVPVTIIVFGIPGLGALLAMAATLWAVGGLVASWRVKSA